MRKMQHLLSLIHLPRNWNLTDWLIIIVWTKETNIRNKLAREVFTKIAMYWPVSVLNENICYCSIKIWFDYKNRFHLSDNVINMWNVDFSKLFNLSFLWTVTFSYIMLYYDTRQRKGACMRGNVLRDEERERENSRMLLYLHIVTHAQTLLYAPWK